MHASHQRFVWDIHQLAFHALVAWRCCDQGAFAVTTFLGRQEDQDYPVSSGYVWALSAPATTSLSKCRFAQSPISIERSKCSTIWLDGLNALWWSPAASLQLLGTPNGAPIGSEASVWAVSSPPRNKIVPHQVGQVVILLSVPKFWLSLPKFIIFHLFHNICNHDIHWHKGTFTTTFCEDVLSANHDLTWSKHQTFQLMFTWFGGVLLMPHDNIMLTPLNSLNTHLQPQGNQTANSILDYIYGSTISTGSIKFHPIMIITIVCIICGKNIYQLCCGCNYILFTKFITSNTIQIYSNILYIHVMFNKKTPPSPSLESWVPMQAHASHGGCGCACFHRRPGMSLGLGSTPYLQCDYNMAWNSDT